MTDRVANSVDATVLPDTKRFKLITELVAGKPLIFVPTGAMFLMAEIQHIAPGEGGLISWMAYLAVYAIVIASYRYISKYYRRRFGWVQAKGSEPTTKFVAILLSTLLFLLFFGRWIAHSLDPILDPLVYGAIRFLHQLISDPTEQVNLVPLLVWLAWTFGQRDRFDRNKLLFRACGVLTCAAVVLYPRWHSDALQQTFWKILNEGALGISMMAVGLYEHITLLRLMPKKPGEDVNE